eukprot:g3981.t1
MHSASELAKKQVASNLYRTAIEQKALLHHIAASRSLVDAGYPGAPSTYKTSSAALRASPQVHLAAKVRPAAGRILMPDGPLSPPRTRTAGEPHTLHRDASPAAALVAEEKQQRAITEQPQEKYAKRLEHIVVTLEADLKATEKEMETMREAHEASSVAQRSAERRTISEKAGLEELLTTVVEMNKRMSAVIPLRLHGDFSSERLAVKACVESAAAQIFLAKSVRFIFLDEDDKEEEEDDDDDDDDDDGNGQKKDKAAEPFHIAISIEDEGGVLQHVANICILGSPLPTERGEVTAAAKMLAASVQALLLPTLEKVKCALRIDDISRILSSELPSVLGCESATLYILMPNDGAEGAVQLQAFSPQFGQMAAPVKVEELHLEVLENASTIAGGKDIMDRDGGKDRIQRSGVSTVLCAPLLGSNLSVVGLIEAANKAVGDKKFGPEDTQLLRRFCLDIGPTVERCMQILHMESRLLALGRDLELKSDHLKTTEATINRTQQTQKLFLQISRRVASSTSVGDLVERVVRECRRVTDYHFVRFFMVDAHVEKAWCVIEGTSSLLHAQLNDPAHAALSECIHAGVTIHSTRELEGDLSGEKYDTLYIPLLHPASTAEVVVGVLQVGRKCDPAVAFNFSEPDEELLTVYCQHVALAMSSFLTIDNTVAFPSSMEMPSPRFPDMLEKSVSIDDHRSLDIFENASGKEFSKHSVGQTVASGEQDYHGVLDGSQATLERNRRVKKKRRMMMKKKKKKKKKKRTKPKKNNREKMRNNVASNSTSKRQRLSNRRTMAAKDHSSKKVRLKHTHDVFSRLSKGGCKACRMKCSKKRRIQRAMAVAMMRENVHALSRKVARLSTKTSKLKKKLRKVKRRKMHSSSTEDDVNGSKEVHCDSVSAKDGRQDTEENKDNSSDNHKNSDEGIDKKRGAEMKSDDDDDDDDDDAIWTLREYMKQQEQWLGLGISEQRERKTPPSILLPL